MLDLLGLHVRQVACRRVNLSGMGRVSAWGLELGLLVMVRARAPHIKPFAKRCMMNQGKGE